MSHANAALTPRARLRMARLIVEGGWSPTTAAKMFMVSVPTARKWAARYRADGHRGDAGPLQPATLVPTPDPGSGEEADRGVAATAPPGTGSDRRPPGA